MTDFKNKRTVGALVVLVAALSAGGFAMSKVISKQGATASTLTPAAGKPGAEAMNLVATVNGEPIYEVEITPLLQTMPRAVAVDSYINKVLSAQAAATVSTGDEVASRKRMAEREVLSGLYFSQVGEKETKAASDADISQFYERNLSDSMFTKIESSYILSATEEEATKAAQKLREGDKETMTKLKPFQNNAGKAVPFSPAEFPYDMGKIIQNMKAGEVSGALGTRNGFFVVRVDGVTPGKRPELKDVKEQIRTALVNQRIGDTLQKLRKNAKIELKS